ncbi:MAG TPA: bifunctional methylenetetrahydrofolate dehydrogenase/methenyltetrahydrofolate cyclohydrolase FolD [Burkholderiaceae bacterium]|nr:bifunctional methylenetetrahydrofolate dehydrogenase/methenyltetrahydrofolate cyclohydrolase FolD [Burkholderiaceae bacterium]
MSAQLIDGKAVAAGLRARLADAVAALKASHHLVPGLAVVLVGADPASQIYVRSKSAACSEAGMNSIEHVLDAATTEHDLLALIGRLNRDPAVHGILVQLPLPPHFNPIAVIEAIDPLKDVDGFHPVSVGRLSIGEPTLVPCTPAGCMILLRHAIGALDGAHAVVIGRSNIVGKPMAQLLLAANCTVTVAHSRTRDLAALARSADILVAAVGKPRFVAGAWIRPGACVIDVGINRVASDVPGRTRVVGDVDFEPAREVAGAITPVPGGVGPMTIACLLRNTVLAACRARGLREPLLDEASR